MPCQRLDAFPSCSNRFGLTSVKRHERRWIKLEGQAPLCGNANTEHVTDSLSIVHSS
jgi:hypothetical protein